MSIRITIEQGREILSQCIEGKIGGSSAEVETLYEAVDDKMFGDAVGEPFGLAANEVKGRLGGLAVGLSWKEASGT